MTSSRQTDVVVVGGGIAGLTAANRAAEEGLQVTLVEKGGTEYLCNSRFTGGAFHVCFREIMNDEALLGDAIRKQVPDIALPYFADAVARDGRRAVRWLQAQGIRFIKGGPDEWQQWMLSPPSLVRPGLNWRGRGGDVLLRTLRARLEARGGQFLQDTRARELLMRDGSCRGIVAEGDAGPSEIHARAVVLADGGFQGNLEMLKRHISPRPERLRQRGAGTGNGDGIRMAEAAGAQLIGMDRFYGHVLHRDALQNNDLWPYPIMDHIASAGILVDANGRRFTDEGLGGVYVTNAIAKLDDPLSSYVIFDEAIWNGPARNFILPANPNLNVAGGSMQVAATLAELAQATGLPDAELANTVGAYNKAVESGSPDRLSPPRTASLYQPFPIRTGPFRAIPLAAGITYTMGGIAIDEGSRVLNAGNEAIPGLYAAGCTTGGLEGGGNAGYVGGLAKSAVTGLRAAESIAAQLADA